MRIQHFVLTRFSCRRSQGFARLDQKDPDPLDPARLAFRFMLFESICAPCLKNQSCQDFDWVLLVDKDLPAAEHSRLEQILGKRPRTHLHRYDPNEDLSKLGWLKPYLERPDLVVTTNVDDDDGLPTDFVEALHAHVRQVYRADASSPPFKLLGSNHAVQWDLFLSANNPWGVVSPWRRKAPGGISFPVSCGFSLVCRYPTYDYSVFAFEHRWGEVAFDEPGDALFARLRNYPVSTRGLTRALEIRKTLMRCAAGNGEKWNDWSHDAMYFDVGQATAPVVMLNHKQNREASRLLEDKAESRAVDPERDFAGAAIDWSSVDRYRDAFKKTWRVLFASLHRPPTGPDPSATDALSSLARLRRAIRLRRSLIWRFINV